MHLVNEGKRIYKAVVWRPGVPGERTTVLAEDFDHAERQLRQKYGEDITLSLYNEEDAAKPR